MNKQIISTFHYLFSRIADEKTEDDQYIKRLAGEIRGELETFQLSPDKEGSTALNQQPDLNLIGLWKNENDETYLIQFWINDILITIINFDTPDSKKIKFNFYDFNTTFGTTSAHVINDQLTPEDFQQIKEEYFPNEPNPRNYARFNWGGIRFSKKMDQYVLLANDIDHASSFLSIDFPQLELIRQKFIYEEKQAKCFNQQYNTRKDEIDDTLTRISAQLTIHMVDMSSIETSFTQLEEHVAQLHQNVSERNKLINTFQTNLENFENYRSALPIIEDRLFASFQKNFQHIKKQVEIDLGYARNDLDYLQKKIQVIQLKIELLRQHIERKRNDLEALASKIISAVGIAVGAGQILVSLPNITWFIKLTMMVLSGAVTFGIVDWVMDRKLAE